MDKKKNLFKKVHDFLIDNERVSTELSWIVRIWYILLTVGSTIYVLCNFCCITEFTFFSNFNGRNLIFILWLVLLVLPFFDSFEGFGVSFNRNQKKMINNETKAVADNLMDNLELNKQPENLKADLEAKLKSTTKKGGKSNE
ncbi:hypothetical protein FACS189441_0010 [Betaproteobacteria bacterium]|nr:hypothetical protein FACS189441_0010 [Betaproteobacteria bacterium]